MIIFYNIVILFILNKKWEANVEENGSPMSFKLPVEVINEYKGSLEKKSSFKKSLTREIQKMCEYLTEINDCSFIVSKIEKLENELKLNKSNLLFSVLRLSKVSCI